VEIQWIVKYDNHQEKREVISIVRKKKGMNERKQRNKETKKAEPHRKIYGDRQKIRGLDGLCRVQQNRLDDFAIVRVGKIVEWITGRKNGVHCRILSGVAEFCRAQRKMMEKQGSKFDKKWEILMLYTYLWTPKKVFERVCRPCAGISNDTQKY
jgi:hypothetical protein